MKSLEVQAVLESLNFKLDDVVNGDLFYSRGKIKVVSKSGGNEAATVKIYRGKKVYFPDSIEKIKIVIMAKNIETIKGVDFDEIKNIGGSSGIKF
jgi:hypothetical protein